MNLIVSKCWQGQSKKGVNFGAEILSKHFQYYQKNKNLKVTNISTKQFNNKINGFHHVFKYNNNALKNENFPINLGGDHSISGGSVASSIKKYGNDLRLVWVDAHADLNTINSSPSNNYHGMPVASLLHLMKPWINVSALKPEQIIYIGLRDLDPFEKNYINTNNIINFNSNEIRTKGIDYVFNEINDVIKNKKIHYSFDIDSMDPIIAPSTGSPVKNGLYCNDIYFIQKKIFELADVVNCDFVEYNPKIGKKYDNEITKHTYRKILDQFINLYKIKISN